MTAGLKPAGIIGFSRDYFFLPRFLAVFFAAFFFERFLAMAASCTSSELGGTCDLRIQRHLQSQQLSRGLYLYRRQRVKGLSVFLSRGDWLGVRRRAGRAQTTHAALLARRCTQAWMIASASSISATVVSRERLNRTAPCA